MASSQLSPMKLYSFITWLLISLQPIVMGNHPVPMVDGRCRKDQQSLLLQLKYGLKFNHSSSEKMVAWNSSIDCCEWPGVRCDLGGLGRVVGLDLSRESITGGGGLHDSTALFSLQYLEVLNLGYNRFNTTIPAALANLTNLRYLDLQDAYFYGQIPTQWESIHKLTNIDLSHNFLNGSIPPSLFSIPSLEHINLSSNQLQCQVPEFSSNSSSIMESIDLRNNHLEGLIPRSFFELPSLRDLWLSSNRFSGRVELSWFQTLQNLVTLDLSYNNLTVDASMINKSSTSPIFPHLDTLNLVSCNLIRFPELGNQLKLTQLDLSDNHINGVVPRWIMESSSLQLLNLSHNNLVSFEVQSLSSSPQYLDMHDNQLQGNFPSILSSSFSTAYMDFSHNHFNGFIPAGIFHNHHLYFLSLSNNSFLGTIPTMVCNLAYLQVLDFSNNHLNDIIPSCLMKSMKNLSVLDLKGNMFSGDIPDTFQASCALQTLNLNNNRLEGTLPVSLEKCTKLEVLDIGNNKISGPFPCLQGLKPSLRVLILRNNLFSGGIQCSYADQTTWQQLQIIDLALNNFSGPLNAKYLASWEAMMDDGKGTQDLIDFRPSPSSRGYYQDSIDVTTKGNERKFVKVLKIFKSIDMSSNNFDGTIPKVIGQFKALQVLNLSHNAFISRIPSGIGNLSSLESLDLSHNTLSGHIPNELADLTFLSFLNLSNNHLLGSIPAGRQLQTFENTSYGGNPKLCGKPLTRSCTLPNVSFEFNVDHEKSFTRVNWDFLCEASGYVFGLAAVMLPAACWPSFRVWFWPKIDSLIIWMFAELYVKDWNNRLRRSQSRRHTKRIVPSR